MSVLSVEFHSFKFSAGTLQLDAIDFAFFFVWHSGADVFFSNREDMFQVFVNSMNGIHSVNVDPQYKVGLQFLWHCLSP